MGSGALVIGLKDGKVFVKNSFENVQCSEMGMILAEIDIAKEDMLKIYRQTYRQRMQ